ncbi:MAG: leucyl/phenylalanyl-tRNA--protein transferase [Acidobacteriota bacterium]|nr:leucyl/phenylalanyl-tRNA--protein transferase [Acidobacteriota bacterium]MDQ7088663.1 leucyl/phenylalanyl-tRNA--protein transferase [Acidobacteriota bacterium]
MPVFELDNAPTFPPPHFAEPGGLLAVGGDLSPRRLLTAYAAGIFPWPHEGYPLLWFSPDPRMVLVPDRLHVARRLRRRLRQRPYRVTLDTACPRVIEACATVPRGRETGTWITAEMIEAYVRLHELGFVHSAEAWRGEALVGGIYGVSLGGAFIGESMFHRADGASRAAFIALVLQIRRWGFGLLDAQVPTDHVRRYGARPWPRSRYLKVLARLVEQPTRRGRWQLDEDLTYPLAGPADSAPDPAP